LHEEGCRHTAGLFPAHGAGIHPFPAGDGRTLGAGGDARVARAVLGVPPTRSAQSSPVQQEGVRWVAFSWPCPSVPTMSPASRVAGLDAFWCGKGWGGPLDPSQPAVGTEGAPQLLNLGGTQWGQGCAAWTPVVAEPLHGLLQPRDPKPAGDLWEGGRGGLPAPVGQSSMLCRLLHQPREGLQGRVRGGCSHPAKYPQWGGGPREEQLFPHITAYK